MILLVIAHQLGIEADSVVFHGQAQDTLWFSDEIDMDIVGLSMLDCIA